MSTADELESAPPDWPHPERPAEVSAPGAAPGVDDAVAAVLKRITYYAIHPADPRSLEQLRGALQGFAAAIVERAKREALAAIPARKPSRRRATRKRG